MDSLVFFLEGERQLGNQKRTLSQAETPELDKRKELEKRHRYRYHLMAVTKAPPPPPRPPLP